MKSEVLSIYSELQRNQLLYMLMKTACEVKDDKTLIHAATEFLNGKN